MLTLSHRSQRTTHFGALSTIDVIKLPIAFAPKAIPPSSMVSAATIILNMNMITEDIMMPMGYFGLFHGKKAAASWSMRSVNSVPVRCLFGFSGALPAYSSLA
jgi:hypothetical protein